MPVKDHHPWERQPEGEMDKKVPTRDVCPGRDLMLTRGVPACGQHPKSVAYSLTSKA
jgi:hypothetical protein